MLSLFDVIFFLFNEKLKTKYLGHDLLPVSNIWNTRIPSNNRPLFVRKKKYGN